MGRAGRLQAGLRRRLDRQHLLMLLSQHAICAEIGTWRGDFARSILWQRRPQRLYLIDPWQCSLVHTEALYSRDQWAMDEIYCAVAKRFARQINRGQVQIKRECSHEAASSFEPESLDWVYVNGDHTYEGVKTDLEAYYPLLKRGGLLAGDDYGLVDRWNWGVTPAVDEFAHNGQLQTFGAQFVIHKR
jgi:hypothetical protein